MLSVGFDARRTYVRAVVVLVWIAATTLVGCAPETISVRVAIDPSSAPPAENSMLMKQEDPPRQPPKVRMGGVTVPTLSSEWLDVDSGAVTYARPSSDMTLADLPGVKRGAGSALLLEIDSGIRLARIDVKYSDGVDAAGHPNGAIYTACLERGDRCTQTKSGSGISYELAPPNGTVAIVVMLTYDLATSIDAKADPAISGDYVSYGVRLETQ